MKTQQSWHAQDQGGIIYKYVYIYVYVYVYDSKCLRYGGLVYRIREKMKVGGVQRYKAQAQPTKIFSMRGALAYSAGVNPRFAGQMKMRELTRRSVRSPPVSIIFHPLHLSYSSH